MNFTDTSISRACTDTLRSRGPVPAPRSAPRAPPPPRPRAPAALRSSGCRDASRARPPMRGSRGGPLDVSGGIEIRRRPGASSRPYACARHRPGSPQPRRARTALPRPLQTECAHHRARLPLHDSQQRPRRPGRTAAPLLPVLQGSLAHVQEGRHLSLRHPELLANGPHVRHGQLTSGQRIRMIAIGFESLANFIEEIPRPRHVQPSRLSTRARKALTSAGVRSETSDLRYMVSSSTCSRLVIQ